MKVLLLTDGIFPFVMGGMQKHSFYLTKMLVQHGAQVTLLHCVPHGKPLPTHQEVLKAMDLEDTSSFRSVVLSFPQSGWLPGHYLKESYLFSKLIYDRFKDELASFDFIYAKGFTAWHLIHEKQRGRKLPPIGVKFHGYEMFQTPPSFKARLQHLLLKGPVRWNTQHADYVFSYGGKITDIIRSLGVESQRVIEIPTGIESTWLVPKVAASTRLQLVFLGRFERRKGIVELNQALKSLLTEGDFTFHFIGPIPPTKRIKHERVVYHGAIMDIKELWKIMDTCQVLVVPSHSEGMPNVIMEGMARGLAVLATPVGAVETVVNNENGWLVKPGDVKELTDTLRQIIHADPAVIRERQMNARKKIESFLWENVGKQVFDVLKRQ